MVAASGKLGLHFGIAEFGEGGLVDLHVSAAGRGQRFEFAAERRYRCRPRTHRHRQ